MTVDEVCKLRNFIKKDNKEIRDRIEAWLLLWEFWRLSELMARHARDRAMVFVLSDELLKNLNKPQPNSPWWRMPKGPIPRGIDTESLTAKGAQHVPLNHSFDLPVLAQFVLSHNRPGGANFAVGTVVDYAFWYHYRSLFTCSSPLQV